MAYLGTPPRSRVLSSADIDSGAVTLDDISFTDQSTSVNVSGNIDKHTMRLSDQVVIDGDLNITDNLILSKISDDGNAIILTTDGSTRTIEGAGGSLEASTLTQTPNASLTGMTGEIGSAVTGTLGSGVTISSGITIPSNNYTKTYTTLLGHGYSNSATITNAGSGQGLPATTDGILIGTSPDIVLNGSQEVFCIVNQCIGDWQANGGTHMVCWGTKDSGSSYQFMGGHVANDWGSICAFSWKAGTGGRHSTLAAGTWVFTVRIGPAAAQTYGSWWGGAGVYGGDQWGDASTIGAESSTAGNMIIHVGGKT